MPRDGYADSGLRQLADAPAQAKPFRRRRIAPTRPRSHAPVPVRSPPPAGLQWRALRAALSWAALASSLRRSARGRPPHGGGPPLVVRPLAARPPPCCQPRTTCDTSGALTPMSRALARGFPIWTWIVSPSTTQTTRPLSEPQASCSVPDTRVKEVRPAGRRREIQLSVEGGAIQNEREVDRDPARRRHGGPDAPLGDDRAPGLFAVDHPLNRATGIGYAAGAGHGRCAIGFWGGQRPSRAPSVKLSGPEGARGWAA